MQMLQNRGQIVFGIEERAEILGGPLPAASVTARDLIEAAKSGYEYRQDDKSSAWALIKKNPQPVLFIDSLAALSTEMEEFARAFRLKRGLTKYDITQETLSPFSSSAPAEGLTNLDLETRSLLQVLYYVSHGIDVPPEHVARGVLTVTRDESGEIYDWPRIMRGLFHVRWAPSDERPPGAHVATQYGGYWFYDSPCPNSDSRSSQTFLHDWENDVACADLVVFVPRSVAKDADCVTQNPCAIVGRFGRRAVSRYRRPRRV